MEISKHQVIYEDNHIIAINKPIGWLVHEDKTGDVPLSEYVKQYIKIRYKKPGKVFLGVIHRIDRPVSGIVLFARTSKALTRMTKLFRENNIQKMYWAVTNETPEELEGKLVHWLRKNPENNKTEAFSNERKSPKNAKRSELSYALKATFAKNNLLEVRPISGRSHQIRAQLAKMKCPIRSDVKYGYKGKLHPDGGIYLHARGISFEHPVKKEPIEIWAAPPDEQIWNEFKDMESKF